MQGRRNFKIETNGYPSPQPFSHKMLIFNHLSTTIFIVRPLSSVKCDGIQILPKIKSLKGPTFFRHCSCTRQYNPRARARRTNSSIINKDTNDTMLDNVPSSYW